MKTIKTITIGHVALIVILFTSSMLFAQRSDTLRYGRWHGRGYSNRPLLGIPNLTEDQKTKIKAQQVAFGKEALPLSTQLAEKRAHLRTLQTAAAYDANAVNSTIDDITKTESQLMKKRAANHEAIRKLLTDEQRLAFDSRKGFARGHGKGHGQRVKHRHRVRFN